MQSDVKKRIVSLDVLKALAIMLIFFYHIVVDVYILNPMFNLKFFMDIVDTNWINLIMVAVALFVTISGITTYMRHKDTKWYDFYKNRFNKILIPFYIVYVMYFIIKSVTFHTYRFFGGVNRLNIIWTILGMDEYIKNYGLNTFSLGIGEWFLGCIIICYLLFPLLVNLYRKYKIFFLIIINIYIVLLCIFNNNLNPPIHMNILYQIYFFSIGIFIGDFYETIDSLRKRLNIYGIVFTIIFLILLYLQILFNRYNIYINVIFLTIFIIYTFMSYFEHGFEKIKKVDYINKAFNFFTNISYEFFLIHHFVIYEISYLVGYKKLRGYEMLLYFIIAFLITILLSYIVKYIELFYKNSIKKLS